MIDSRNLSNLRTQFFNKSHCSDLLLQISDIGSHPTRQRMAIHANILVLYSASRYFQSCLTSHLNQQNKSITAVNDSGALLPNKLVLKLELDFEQLQLSEEVVELFFSLFYLARFDRDIQIQEALHYNILALYQLASFFLFDALTAYIEEYLIGGMCLAYFTPLFRFCLRLDERSGCYELIEPKEMLFNRLLQWYQCCVESSATLPSNTAVAADTQYYVHDKPFIMEELRRRVTFLEQRCDLPSKEIVRDGGSAESLQLRYYHKICPACLESVSRKSCRVGPFGYTDMGKLSDCGETFSFRLKKRARTSRHSPRHFEQQESVGIEVTRHQQEECRYECKSRVTLLSRKRQCDTKDHHYSEKDISVPSEIATFTPHKVKYCYDGYCEHCHEWTALYILLMCIELRRHLHAPILEEMGMHVEEARSDL